jgi:predicted AAA+ superfamily ATPase
MNAYQRQTAASIKSWLFNRKAIVLIGARQVGKTTLLEQLFANESDLLWLNADETHVRQRLEVHNIEALKAVVGSYKLLIIDEVQRIKNAGILLKLLTDNFKDVQVVATGSSSLDISASIFEPLTGRHVQFYLYPLGMSELYAGKSVFEVEQQLPFHLVYGCYPDICLHRAKAKTLLQNLTDNYLYKDVLIWKEIRKPALLDKLLKLLAYQVGAEVSLNELSNQLQVNIETVDRYIDLLEKSYVIFRLAAYSTNPRKEVTKMHKIYFWDNGVRNAVIGDFNDLSNRNDHGQLWENFIIAERLKFLSWQEDKPKSYFWRNYNQSEVDYVEHSTKKLAAFEFKWNTYQKHRVSKAFTNEYPHATTDVITPLNFAGFCGLL